MLPNYQFYGNNNYYGNYLGVVQNFQNGGVFPALTAAAQVNSGVVFRQTFPGPTNSVFFSNLVVTNPQILPRATEANIIPNSFVLSENLSNNVSELEKNEVEKPVASVKKNDIEKNGRQFTPRKVEVKEFARGMMSEGYNFGSKNKKKTTWYCIKAQANGCPAKIHKLQDGTWELYDGPHSCIQSDHSGYGKKVFYETCKQIQDSCYKLEPYESFSLAEKEHPEHAAKVCFPEIQRTLQRHRSNAKPQFASGLKRGYNSIWKFAKHCEQHPEDLKLVDKDGKEHGQLQGKLIKSSSRTYHFLMYDPELMEEFDEGNEVFLDGTFDTRPQIKGVGQLLTIMSKKFNVIHPIAWVLMNKRTTKAYNAVFEEIKNLFPNFRPQVAMSDYEKGLRRALRESFKGIKIYGCAFHYSQAIMKNARQHKLISQYDNKEKNPKVHRVLKKIMALTYLPPEKIQEGLELVEKEALSVGTEQGTTALWTNFFAYYNREWMTTVKPANFSVFNAPDRTNNCIERYHRDLNQWMGHKPSVRKFIDALVTIKEKTKLNLQRSRNNLRVHMKSKSVNGVRDERIRAAMMNIHPTSEKPWSVKRFLTEVAEPESEIIFEVMDIVENAKEREIATKGPEDDYGDDSDDEEHNGVDSDIESPDHGEFFDAEENNVFNPLPDSCFERPDDSNDKENQPDSAVIESEEAQLKLQGKEELKIKRKNEGTPTKQRQPLSAKKKRNEKQILRKPTAQTRFGRKIKTPASLDDFE